MQACTKVHVIHCLPSYTYELVYTNVPSLFCSCPWILPTVLYRFRKHTYSTRRKYSRKCSSLKVSLYDIEEWCLSASTCMGTRSHCLHSNHLLHTQNVHVLHYCTTTSSKNWACLCTLGTNPMCGHNQPLLLFNFILKHLMPWSPRFHYLLYMCY